jgi:hypothetical protein
VRSWARRGSILTEGAGPLTRRIRPNGRRTLKQQISLAVRRLAATLNANLRAKQGCQIEYKISVQLLRSRRIQKSALQRLEPFGDGERTHA